jgi:hypothetical protein
MIGDLDQEGGSEVLAGADDVYALGVGGGLLWRYPTSSYVSQVALSLLDNAGANQVVAATRYPDPSVSILDAKGMLVWRQELDASPSVVVAEDVDKDGGHEVLVGALDGRVRLFGDDGAPRWERQLAGPISDLELGDPGGDGISDVVVGTGDYLSPGGVYVLDTLSGSLLAAYTGLEGATFVDVRDTDQNRGEEIVAASGSEVYLLRWAGGR